MTAGLVFGLTIYAFTTKTDYTAYGGLIWACGTILVLFSLFTVFFGVTLKLIFCTIAILIFSLYLVFDTQTIMGGEGKYAEIEKDDYILGAIILYLDIINIFLYLVQILSTLKD
jgi:FtsH-binding integral membrane protein